MSETAPPPTTHTTESLREIAAQIKRLSTEREAQARGAPRPAPAPVPPPLTATRSRPHPPSNDNLGQRPAAPVRPILVRTALVAHRAGLFLALVWMLVCPLLYPDVASYSADPYVSVAAVLSLWAIPSITVYLAGRSVRYIILGDRRA